MEYTLLRLKPTGKSRFGGPEVSVVYTGASLIKIIKIHESTIRYISEYLSAQRNHNRGYILKKVMNIKHENLSNMKNTEKY